MVDFAFHTLLQNVLPNVQGTHTVRFDVDTALETQVAGSSGYSQLLPRFVTRDFNPPVPTETEQQRALRRLDERLRARVFEARLALLAAGHSNAELYVLGSGRACLRVRKEFVVTLTIMLDQKHEPWGVLRVQIMVRSDKDPVEGVMSPQQLQWFANSLDRRFRQPKYSALAPSEAAAETGSFPTTTTTNEATLVQDAPGDNSPIPQIYAIMHGFCLSLALDKLSRQAQSLAASSWQHVVQVVDDVPVNKRLSLVYWSTSSSSSSLPFAASFSSGPKSLRYQRFPREPSIDVFIDGDNYLSVAHAPEPLVDPVTGQASCLSLSLNELNLEPLLEQAIQLNAYSKLEALRVFASSVTTPQLLRQRPDAAHPDCLLLPLFPPDTDIALLVTIDKSTGLYIVELSTPYASFTPRPTALSRRINASFSHLESIFAELRFSSTVERLVRLLSECGYQAFAERLPSPHFSYPIPASSTDQQQRFLRIFARSTVNFHCFVHLEVVDVEVRCLSFIRASKPLPSNEQPQQQQQQAPASSSPTPTPSAAAAATPATLAPSPVQAPNTSFEYDTVPLPPDMSVRDGLAFCHDVLHKIMHLHLQVRHNIISKEFRQNHPSALEVAVSPSFTSLKVSKAVFSNLQLDFTFSATADTWTVDAFEPGPRTSSVPFAGYASTSALERPGYRAPVFSLSPAEGHWRMVFSSPVTPDSFGDVWSFFTGISMLLSFVNQWDRLVAAKSVVTTRFHPPLWTSCSLTFAMIDRPTCRVAITAHPVSEHFHDHKQAVSTFPHHPLLAQLETFFWGKHNDLEGLLSGVHTSLAPATAIADYFSRHLLSPPGQVSLVPQGTQCLRLVLLGTYNFDLRFMSADRLALIDRTSMLDFPEFCASHLVPLWPAAEGFGVQLTRNNSSSSGSSSSSSSSCCVLPASHIDAVLDRLYRYVGLCSFASSLKSPKIQQIIQSAVGEIAPSVIQVNPATQTITIRPLEASAPHYELSVVMATQFKLSAKKPEQVFVNSEPHQLFDMLGAKPKAAQQTQGGETLSPDGIVTLGEFCNRRITSHPYSPFHLGALLALLLLPVPLLNRLVPLIKESALSQPRFHLVLSHPSGEPFVLLEREELGKRRLTFSVRTSDEQCQRYIYSQSADRFQPTQVSPTYDPASDSVLAFLNERRPAAQSSVR